MQKFLAIVMLAVCWYAVSAPVNSMLGADGAELCAEDFDNPYITDGLVAMWDGEWNAGPWLHDSNATTWENLVGNTISLTLEGGYSFGENYIEFQSGGYAIDRRLQDLSQWDGITIESIQYTPRKTVSFGWNYWSAPYASTYRFGLLTGNNYGAPVALHGRNYDTYKDYTFFIGLYSTAVVIDMSISGQRTSQLFVNTVEQTPMRVGPDSDFTKNLTAAFSINTVIGADFERLLANNKFYAVRVYSRALSPEEIAYNYAIDCERFGLE